MSQAQTVNYLALLLSVLAARYRAPLHYIYLSLEVRYLNMTAEVVPQYLSTITLVRSSS